MAESADRQARRESLERELQNVRGIIRALREAVGNTPEQAEAVFQLERAEERECCAPRFAETPFSPHFPVRPDGAYHQWRRVPPGELSIAPVADERFGRATDWAGALSLTQFHLAEVMVWASS